MNNLTFGKLDRKFPKSNTIAQNQHYMEKLLSNETTSFADKMVAIDYIYANRIKFTPLPTDTDDPIMNEINIKINGNRARQDFIEYSKSIIFPNDCS